MGRGKKPDLHALYQQKEQDRIEKQAEIDYANMIVKWAIAELDGGVAEFKKTHDFTEFRKYGPLVKALLWNRVNMAEFKHLNKFDIQRIWETAIEGLRRRYGISKGNAS